MAASADTSTISEEVYLMYFHQLKYNIDNRCLNIIDMLSTGQGPAIAQERSGSTEDGAR